MRKSKIKVFDFLISIVVTFLLASFVIMPVYADFENVPEPGWFWKDYNGKGVADGYLPDFDQRQNGWYVIQPGPDGTIESDPTGTDDDFEPGPPPLIGPGGNGKTETPVDATDVQHWVWCTPTATADSLWWLHQRFSKWKQPILPPNLLNPVDLINHLAKKMDTGGQDSGTAHKGTFNGFFVQDGELKYDPDGDDEEKGIDKFIKQRGLEAKLSKETKVKPSFDWIEKQVEKSEDVKLDLGFFHVKNVIPVGPDHWIIVWELIGKHSVAVAGVNSNLKKIALSDPDADNKEAGGAGVVRPPGHLGHPRGANHNNGVNASHDIYDVVDSISPGGQIAIKKYLGISEVPNAFLTQAPEKVHMNLDPAQPLEIQADYFSSIEPPPVQPSTVYTEVLKAVAISPKPVNGVNTYLLGILGLLAMATGFVVIRRGRRSFIARTS